MLTTVYACKRLAGVRHNVGPVGWVGMLVQPLDLSRPHSGPMGLCISSFIS